VTGASQGDTPFLSNWTATFDIPLRALELTPPKPFLIRNERDLIKAQVFSFADDVLSLLSKREGLQEKADIMSGTAAILGILFAKIMVTRTIWSADTDYPLVVHDRDWQMTEYQLNTPHQKMETSLSDTLEFRWTTIIYRRNNLLF